MKSLKAHEGDLSKFSDCTFGAKKVASQFEHKNDGGVLTESEKSFED